MLRLLMLMSLPDKLPRLLSDESSELTLDIVLNVLIVLALPIMAVTAYAGKGDEEQIRAAGAEAYVSKPISVIKFIESVGAFA